MSRRLWPLILSSIVLTIVVSASAANAQLPGTAGAPQSIQGTVRYAIGSKPVEHVVVRCSGTGGISEQVTDANGKFRFMVTAGHYDCSVRVPGYRSESRSLDVLNSGEFLDFRIRDDGSAKSAGPNAGTSAGDANIPPKAREEFDKGAAAIALGKKENLEEGVLHLEKAVALYPQYLQAQLMLGTTYMDVQQFDKAEPALKKTVEIDPKAANALFALGEIYLRQKKDDDAEKVLLQGLQIEDRSFQGHLILARVYVDMAAKIKDDTQNRPLRVKAFDQVNEALKYNADLAQAHFIKGNLLLSVGRDHDAQHEYEEYLRLDPKGPFADKAKGWIEKIKKALGSEKKP
jgi:tetratricopeptide (TPR) repeat protein